MGSVWIGSRRVRRHGLAVVAHFNDNLNILGALGVKKSARAHIPPNGDIKHNMFISWGIVSHK